MRETAEITGSIGGRGLVLLHTGAGKGKTTAALGLALRMLGHGGRVCLIQFLKGQDNTGECRAAKVFGDRFEVHVLGRGFTWRSEDLAQDIAAARAAWDFARRVLAAGGHDLVILDEITYLPRYGMVAAEEIVAGIASRPAAMHVVLTGRDADPLFVSAADLVSEVREVKHPYTVGLPAQRGIEY